MNGTTNKSARGQGSARPSGRTSTINSDASGRSHGSSGSGGVEPRLGGKDTRGRAKKLKDYTKVPHVSGGRGRGPVRRVASSSRANAKDHAVAASAAEEIARLKGALDAEKELRAELTASIDEVTSGSEGKEEPPTVPIAPQPTPSLIFSDLVDRSCLGWSFDSQYISTNTPGMLVVKCLAFLCLWSLYCGVFAYLCSVLRLVGVLFLDRALYRFAFFFFYACAAFAVNNAVISLTLSWAIFKYGSGKDLLVRKARYTLLELRHEYSESDNRPEVISMGNIKYSDAKLGLFRVDEDFIWADINMTLLSESVHAFWHCEYVQSALGYFVLAGSVVYDYLPVYYQYFCQRWIRRACRSFPTFPSRRHDDILIYMEIFAQLRSADLMVLSRDQELGRGGSPVYSEADFFSCHAASLKLYFEKIQYAARRLNTINVNRFDFLTGQLYVQNTVKMAQIFYENQRRTQYVNGKSQGFPGACLR